MEISGGVENVTTNIETVISGFTLTELSDVTIASVTENHILKYTGTNWVNVDEVVLDTDLILNTAIDYGYLKAAKNIDMVEGYYDNIQHSGELSVIP